MEFSKAAISYTHAVSNKFLGKKSRIIFFPSIHDPWLLGFIARSVLLINLSAFSCFQWTDNSNIYMSSFKKSGNLFM